MTKQQTQKAARECGCDIDEGGRLHDLSCPVARAAMQSKRAQAQRRCQCGMFVGPDGDCAGDHYPDEGCR